MGSPTTLPSDKPRNGVPMGSQGAEPNIKPNGPATGSSAAPATGAEGEEDDDEERMDVAFIQGFADKIQRLPTELVDGIEMSRPKISIPKRGEKDFEPLQETVNLQEMMLQNSRQALFDALQGVRGVSGKALSHAIITPASPFPQLLVSRGHVLDTLGITVRRATPFADKPVARVELLPEEAMYLAERGTLQIWNGRDPVTEAEFADGVGAWCDEEFGIKGAIEMSVMEVFGQFMGKEGLSWQRYQAYAYLKRLGYTVQRTRQFIPEHFLATSQPSAGSSGQSLIRQFLQLPSRLLQWISTLASRMGTTVSDICRVGLGLPVRWSRPLSQTVLKNWTGSTYASIFSHLRFVPAGHSNPVPQAPMSSQRSSIYDPLLVNPYLPFFNVWKPVTSWSKVKWDKGSAEGIAQQKPDYILAVVESRETPMPTLAQLDVIFRTLPEEPKGPVRRVGPQYERKRPAYRSAEVTELSWWTKFWQKIFPQPQPSGGGNAVNALRNGDRALIVAVNDSGNTGWVRFGRTGFESVAMA